MNLKDKLFNGLVLGGACVVCAIIAAFLFQDILGYKINLFKKEVVEEETMVTVVEVETESKDYSHIPTVEEMIAKREERLKREEEERLALAKLESERVEEVETATLPAIRAEETQPSKIVVKDEPPTVITNGEASSFISNPVVGKDGNVTNKNNDLEPETTRKTIKDVEEEKENPITPNSNGTAPNTSTGKTLSEVEEMWQKAKEEGGDSSTNTVEILEIGELSGEHTGY